ncbi:MAG: Coenzyme F420 hydrogenase/dehydrogenase, beta subunit C-terminal domain [Candidatus Hodarchaeales archaeon]|jgi:coenzyme F420 hydrogenase subunit beta
MSRSREEFLYSESYRLSKAKLKDDKGAKFARLKKDVIDTGLCSACGACVASCAENVLTIIGERPKLVGRCTACGVCIHQCPKTKTIIPQLIGDFKAAYRGKTLLPEVEGRGQDGGIVTSLLLYLMREKLIDAAVVLQKDEKDPWKPKPMIATSEEDILKSAGSVYSQGQTIGALIDAIKHGYHSIAFVGTPCNIDAVTKMQDSPYGVVRLFMRARVLKIGLFCMDAFNYDRLREWIEDDKKVDLESVDKMTISKGKFIVTTSEGGEKAVTANPESAAEQEADNVIISGGGEKALNPNPGSVDKQKTDNVAISVPISKVDHLRASSCYYCIDLTSENADISVGSVGAPDGYNSILARTGLGLELLQDAADNDYIEINPLSRKKLKPVLNLANMKKVQLYTINRRRSFVLQTPIEPTITKERTEVQELFQETEEKPERKMVRVLKQELVNDQQYMRLVLKNITGKVLEQVKIRIASVAGELVEATSWETVVREWFPSENLEFEFPKQRENEYILAVKDDKGKIMAKRLDIKRFKVVN